jgi:hypothetical protein
MIGTDLVTTKSNRFITMQDDRSLSIGYEGLVIKFSQFDGGFEIGNTLNHEVRVSDEQGAGDRWELA